jgi:hypothetical protein
MISRTFAFFVVIIILSSCGSSMKSLESVVESNLKVDPKLEGGLEYTKSRLENDTLIQIDAPNKKEIPLDATVLDSLYTVLMDEKELVMDIAYKPFYDLLLTKNLTDTTYLTNIYAKTPTDGSPLSYEFDVMKNDIITYSIENIKGFKVDEISIMEGGSYRMVNQKLKKKQTDAGTIRIMDDNTLTLNIINDGFFKNKGFFGSNVKIQLKKVSPFNIKYEEVLDSVSITKKSIEIVVDTIYNSSYETKFELNSILDITGKDSMVVPINVSQEDMNLMGWGYWVGLNNFNSLDWASNEDNDMINYAKQELFNEDSKLSLQASENDNIKLRINNISLDSRTLNYSTNYAFYKTDNTIEKPDRRAEIILENLSTINSFKIQLGLVAVFFKERQVELEKEVYETKKLIKLTLEEE